MWWRGVGQVRKESKSFFWLQQFQIFFSYYIACNSILLQHYMNPYNCMCFECLSHDITKSHNVEYSLTQLNIKLVKHLLKKTFLVQEARPLATNIAILNKIKMSQRAISDQIQIWMISCL